MFDPKIYRTEEELSGLVNEGLRAYKNTLKRGGFVREDAEDTAIIHHNKIYAIQNWARDKLEWGNKDDKMFMIELESSYKNWCRNNNTRVEFTGRSFTRKFRLEFQDIHYVDERRIGSRGHQKVQILGVKLKYDINASSKDHTH